MFSYGACLDELFHYIQVAVKLLILFETKVALKWKSSFYLFFRTFLLHLLAEADFLTDKVWKRRGKKLKEWTIPQPFGWKNVLRIECRLYWCVVTNAFLAKNFMHIWKYAVVLLALSFQQYLALEKEFLFTTSLEW